MPGDILHVRIDLEQYGHRLGLQLSDQVGSVPTDKRGVFVVGFLPESAAAKNDVIRVGDQLIQVLYIPINQGVVLSDVQTMQLACDIV